MEGHDHGRCNEAIPKCVPCGVPMNCLTQTADVMLSIAVSPLQVTDEERHPKVLGRYTDSKQMFRCGIHIILRTESVACVGSY
jgi:hypothetical protein